MSMLNRNKKEPKLETVEPFHPPARLSHRAASVAHEMEQLEADLHTATVYGQEQANARKVAEGMIAELKTENTHLLNERDDIQRRFIELDSRLRSAARVLVDVLSEPKTPPMPEAVAAVEKALEEPTPQE
jgi:hypothetical protein